MVKRTLPGHASIRRDRSTMLWAESIKLQTFQAMALASALLPVAEAELARKQLDDNIVALVKNLGCEHLLRKRYR